MKKKGKMTPLLSEHGGSFTEDAPTQEDQKYNPRREVEKACRLLGGKWLIKDLPCGAVVMQRLSEQEHA